MEKHIENIELINQYINGQLSESERLNFENQLETNPEFNTLYQEQLTFLGGLKRVQLKTEIASAKSSYITTKWLKIFGLPIVVIGLGVLCYSLFFKTNRTIVKEPVVTNTVVVFDSINNQKQTEYRKDSIKIKVEKEAVLKPIESTSKIERTTTKNNKTESKIVLSKPEVSDLTSFYRSVEKEPQIFKINTKKDTIIRCKEGTVLKIKANSFVYKELDINTIQFYVTEYYNLDDILLANLTTKSNDKQLETGGMLNVYGLLEEELVTMKPGSFIEYEFPSNNPKSGMQLFLGEKTKEGVNWKLENKISKTSETVTTSEIVFPEEEDVEVSIQHVEEVPVFPGCENSTNTEKQKCMSEAFQELINKNFNSDLETDVLPSGTYKIYTSFKIDKEGEVVDIQATAYNTLLAQEAIRVLELMPKMKPGKQRGRKVIVPYSLPITFKISGSDSNRKRPNNITVKAKTSFEKKFEAQLKNKDSVKGEDKPIITAKQVSRYAFYGSKLGWINCDRFVRSSKNAIKFKLKIKEASGADIKMVFKSYNSILPSRRVDDNYDFGTVAVNEEVILVAIKMIDNKLFLGIKDAKIEKVSELDLNFKEVSLEELKTELQKLNKDFN